VKRSVYVVILLLVLGVTSVGVSGEWLRFTTGVSAAYTLWQTSPHRFASETYWGGLGIEVLYRSLSVSAAITLADLETLRIQDDPSIGLGVSLALLKRNDAGLRWGAGTVIHPRTNWIAISTSAIVFWDALPLTTLRAWVGYETVLSGASGSCIFVGAGTTLYFPLL